MSSVFGEHVRYSIFGQSHGEAIGVVIDGLPAGEAIDMDALNAFLRPPRAGRLALRHGAARGRRAGDSNRGLWMALPAARRCARSSATLTRAAGITPR